MLAAHTTGAAVCSPQLDAAVEGGVGGERVRAGLAGGDDGAPSADALRECGDVDADADADAVDVTVLELAVLLSKRVLPHASHSWGLVLSREHREHTARDSTV